MKLVISLVSICLFIAVLLFWWEKHLDNNHIFVVYFGRPSDVLSYTTQSWQKILKGSLSTTIIAFISLLMSAAMALLFLVIGLLSDRWLRQIEKFALISQTIPMLVIVAICYIIEKSIIGRAFLNIHFVWYCFVPVSIVLFFPPLVYGIKGIRDIDTDMKAMLRIWNAPKMWRIIKVYLPQALPHILTGLRVSASWAIVAALITEGLMFGVSNDQFSIGQSLIRPFSGSVIKGQTLTLMIVATILGYFVYYVVGCIQSILQKKVFGIAAENEKNYPIID